MSMSESHNREVARYLTAFHEAGHAVMAAYLEVPFQLVEVTEDGRGAVKNPEGFTADAAIEPIILLAARAAQDKEMRENNIPQEMIDSFLGTLSKEELQTQGSDELRLQLLYEHLADSYVNLRDKIQFAAWRQYNAKKVEEILNLPEVWAAIKMLAGELKGGCSISSERVRSILQETTNQRDTTL